MYTMTARNDVGTHFITSYTAPSQTHPVSPPSLPPLSSPIISESRVGGEINRPLVSSRILIHFTEFSFSLLTTFAGAEIDYL